MTKVKEYVEINGKRVSVTAENLIKAYEKIEKLEKELELLEQRFHDSNHSDGFMETFLIV